MAVIYIPCGPIEPPALALAFMVGYGGIAVWAFIFAIKQFRQARKDRMKVSEEWLLSTAVAMGWWKNPPKFDTVSRSYTFTCAHNGNQATIKLQDVYDARAKRQIIALFEQGRKENPQ